MKGIFKLISDCKSLLILYLSSLGKGTLDLLVIIPDMKFQEFKIQIITLALGVSLLAAGLATTSAYGLVKIISPAKGQHVPVGNIMISGTSSSNTTNHCTVSVIINGIRPYQQATSTGSKGPNDYSNWTFTAITNHSTIKEGMNKITAKYSCPSNMNSTKFYSVNVTGVAAKGQQQPVAPTQTGNTKTTGSAFPPSLPSLNAPIVNESKPSNILKGFK